MRHERRSTHRLLSALAILAGAALFAGGCRLPEQPPPGAAGPVIFEMQLCFNCHGVEGVERGLGPQLAGLTEHWTRERLADFLGAVERWEEEDERVMRLAEEYSGDMRSYDNLSLEERLRLADHLLSAP